MDLRAAADVVNSTQQHQDPLPPKWRLAWTALSLFALYSGGLCNLLVAFVTTSKRQSGCYALIASVALTDASICLLWLPSEVWASVCWHVLDDILPLDYCRWTLPLCETATATSVLCQMWLAVNRAEAVFWPHRFSSEAGAEGAMMKKRRRQVVVRYFLLGSLVPALVFHAPGLVDVVFEHRRDPLLGDCYHRPASPTFSFLMHVQWYAFYLLPACLSLALYLAIFWRLRRTSRTRRQQPNNTRHPTRQGTVRALFGCTLFLIAMLPARLAIAMHWLERFPAIVIAAKLAWRCAFAVNPLFYYLLDADLRAALSSLMQRKSSPAAVRGDNSGVAPLDSAGIVAQGGNCDDELTMRPEEICLEEIRRVELAD